VKSQKLISQGPFIDKLKVLSELRINELWPHCVYKVRNRATHVPYRLVVFPAFEGCHSISMNHDDHDLNLILTDDSDFVFRLLRSRVHTIYTQYSFTFFSKSIKMQISFYTKFILALEMES